jgi:putative SOS response-associated peptidase YedK
MTLTTESLADVVDELLAEIAPDDAALYRPRFNIAPSDLCWIVTPDAERRRVLVPARWGYVAGRRSIINVRAETLASGSGFREAFHARRCAIVSDGFFEWNAAKAPFWFHRSGGGLVLMAGICQAPEPTDPAARPRFTVVTTRPNPLVGEVHDRMPVILERDVLDTWLTSESAPAVTRLLAPAADGVLASRPVSRRVGSVKNDDPACILPLPEDGDASAAEPARASRQTSLF